MGPRHRHRHTHAHKCKTSYACFLLFVSEIMQSAAYICTLWSTRMDNFDNFSSNVHFIDMDRAITQLAIEH